MQEKPQNYHEAKKDYSPSSKESSNSGNNTTTVTNVSNSNSNSNSNNHKGVRGQTKQCHKTHVRLP